MGRAVRATGITYRLDLGMSSGIVMGPHTVDPAPEELAVVIDDEGGEWNATFVDMLDGEGDGLLHELRQAGSAGDHQDAPLSFGLSESFNQTTPAMMTASQNACISVRGWSRRTVPAAAAPTEPMPAHTA